MKRNDALFASHRRLSPDPDSASLPTVNVSQRERVRRCRLAGTTTAFFMLFLLIQFPQAIISKNLAALIALSLGLGVCGAALFLSRRGLTTIAGILILITVYAEGTFTLLHYPNGLTANDLYLLDLTLIPDVLVLVFFSANSLLPIFGLNAIQILVVLLFGPHDSAITQQLQTAPFQIFSHVYALQLVIAAILYIWLRSTEHMLARAIRAEEIVEKREKYRQQQEIAKKQLLDDGIQQILQTHVAVANGDLNARAPLHKDHDLWPVAGTLNNLIARLQSQSHTIHELKQQMVGDNKHTNPSLPKINAQMEMENQRASTGQHPKIVIAPKFPRKFAQKPPRPISEH